VLLELCPASFRSIQGIEDVEELTRFAVTTRYPGVGENVSAADAQRAIEIADRVSTMVRSALQASNFRF
jgi:HEPN domain-containing protein